jgi:formate hydrogenlyase subunit 6/NADH:ubiquinone oxidoreductase subunit I
LHAYKLECPESLRAHLAQGRELYEPRADGQGGTHWQLLGSHDLSEFVYDGEPPLFSAKSFFFPERELLFRFSGGIFYSAMPSVTAQVLFGVHACDLQAVAYQDQFFANDPYYQARRHATLLVGIDCLHSCAGGFCHSLNSGPQVAAHTADLILLPAANHRADWLLLVASEAGAKALSGLQLAPASDDWAALRAANSACVAAEQGAQNELLAGIEALNQGLITSATWETLGLRCLGCSGCTSVCPTCSCSAPLDVPTANAGGARERVWDSCLYQGFQQEASGHNPSASAGQRVQRFWSHKFGDGYKQQFGQYGCVGCGRCDRVCPGAIGVHGVMHKVGTCST